MIVDIDFSRKGKQVSYLYLRNSVDGSAYGAIPIPIAVVASGNGPTVLLTAGAHGDEYEGQVVLAELLREIKTHEISGRLIIIPTLNPPAALAARRVSPLDGGNLNRCFPGELHGGPTSRIAHFIENSILPLCDVWLDLHSGGSSLNTILCVNVLESNDREYNRRCRELANTFGAPLLVLYDDIGGSSTSLAAARRNGVIALNTEMGGGTELSRKGIEMCRSGIANTLADLGVARLPQNDRPVQKIVRILPKSYIFSPASGVLEHLLELGEQTKPGKPVARIHNILDPNSLPLEVFSDLSGMICMNRPIARVEPGDCIALVCPEVACKEESRSQ